MLTTWILLAVLLFWAVGAYNRLVRLRSAAIQAFGGLDAHLVRTITMLGEYEATLLPERSRSDSRAALWAATTQFGASLAVARARPLDASAAAALSTAEQVLGAAWQAVVRDGSASPAELQGADGRTAEQASAGSAEEPATDQAMAAWIIRRDQQEAHNALARRQFNDAVAQYNGAVAQFPASVLAWLFGFHRARPL